MPRDLEERGFYRDERNVLVAQRSALFAIMEASPRRWRAPASGMRAGARVRSAETPRPADPGHRSPPPGAARFRKFCAPISRSFPGKPGAREGELSGSSATGGATVSGARRKDARPSALSFSSRSMVHVRQEALKREFTLFP